MKPGVVSFGHPYPSLRYYIPARSWLATVFQPMGSTIFRWLATIFLNGHGLLLYSSQWALLYSLSEYIPSVYKLGGFLT